MKKLYLYIITILLFVSSTVFAASTIKLNVSAPQTVNIADQTSVAINISVTKPDSSVNISGLSVQAYIENPDKVYIDGDGYAIQKATLDSVTNGTFYLSADKDFSTKTVPIKLKLRYYADNSFTEQEETIYIRVIAPEKNVNPALEISKSPVWSGSIEPSKAFEVPFTIKNTGDSVAKNIKVSLDGLKSGEITLAKGLSTIDITQLEPGQSAPIYFDLKSDAKTPAGSYMLTLKYSFTGDTATSAPKEGTYSFSVDVLKFEKAPSTLEFRNISFPTKTLSQNQTTSISFDVFNTGTSSVNDITVSATSQDQTGLASKSISKIVTKSIPSGKSQKYTFEFITTPSADTKNYPVELKISYKDANDEITESTQLVGVFVKAPKPADPNAKDESPVPKLIIEEYSFSPEIIEAGTPFTMHLTLYNTNATKSVRNIKIFLTSDAQESVSANQSSSQGASSTPSTASVFTPVGSSNTFYVAEIKPGKKISKEITLTTVPDTAAKTYTVVANFEYEDAKANKYQATEQIGVPVVQKAKLDIGDVVPQGDFYVGQDNPVTIDYFNTGKASLYNVMVKISGSNLKFDIPSMYKGTFTPGNSEQFTVSVTPEKPGKQKFEVEFTYEDSTGKQSTLSKSYEFDVQDLEPMEPMDDIPVQSGFNKALLLIPIAVIGVGAGAFIYFKKRKQKKDDDLQL